MSHRTLKVTQRTEETLRMYEIKKRYTEHIFMYTEF